MAGSIAPNGTETSIFIWLVLASDDIQQPSNVRRGMVLKGLVVGAGQQEEERKKKEKKRKEKTQEEMYTTRYK